MKKTLKKCTAVLLAALMLTASFAMWANAVTTFEVDPSTAVAPTGADAVTNLFDGKVDTKYCVNDTAPTVTFETTAACVVNGYAVSSANDWESRNPKAWTFYGSVDGTAWTELDSRADEVFPTYKWTNYYYFENTESYSFYKFEVTQNCGNNYTQFSELTLLNGTPAEGPVVRGAVQRTVDSTQVSGTAPTGSSESLENLFDGNIGNKYCTVNTSAEIVFPLTEAAVVNQYALVAANSTGEIARDPKNWILFGSSDGSTWTELDTRSNQDFVLRKTNNTYTFNNNTPYLWYRLAIIANHGTNVIQFAELMLFGGEVETPESFHILSATVTGTQGNGGDVVDNLFDDDPSTKYLVFRSSDADVVEVSFSLSKAAAINAYTLTSANDADARDPKDWTLYGSADGSAWTVLDTRTDEDLPARQTKYAYNFTNDTAYLWYKFEFTANNGLDPWGYNIIQLADLDVLAVETPIEDENITVLTDSISSSAPYNDSHTADKLFDNDPSTKYLTNGQTAYVIFSLKSAKPINAYSITCANDWASRNPADWAFYGSDDGINWTLLDIRTGETPVGLMQDNRYVFANTTAYKWYKLDVTKNGGNGITGFAELKLEVTNDPALIARQLTIDTSTIIAPEGNGSGEALEKAFDGNKQTKYLVLNNTSFDMIFQLTNPAPINRYSISFANDNLNRTPKKFTLYGSFEGTGWWRLDREDLEEKTSSDPNLYCGGTYSFNNNVVYTYYKLTIEEVSSGSHTAFSEFTVYTSCPEEGLDVYAPSNVTDLTGIPADTIKTLTIKAPHIDDESVAAIDAIGGVTVYGHKLPQGGGVDEQFANCENVTFKNILSIEETYCDTNRGIYNNRNDYTVIAAVNTNDLEISTTTLEFTFKQNGEVVREHSVDIYYVYYTIRGYASANEATADIQELDYIDGAYYLFGVTIIGVPAGTYDVEMRVVAWAGFLGYEVYSDVYYDTITFE